MESLRVDLVRDVCSIVLKNMVSAEVFVRMVLLAGKCVLYRVWEALVVLVVIFSDEEV